VPEYRLTHHTIHANIPNQQGTAVNPPGGDGWRLSQVLPATPVPGTIQLCIIIALWERPLPDELVINTDVKLSDEQVAELRERLEEAIGQDYVRTRMGRGWPA